MAVLDLGACPICRAEYSLTRKTAKIEGHSQISYECIECGSILLWLGGDLWLEADRWAYQKVGREDKEYLLQQTLTASDLQKMISQDPAEIGGESRLLSSHEVSSREWEAGVVDVAPTAPIEEAWYRESPAWQSDDGVTSAEVMGLKDYPAIVVKRQSLPRKCGPDNLCRGRAGVGARRFWP